MATPSVPENVSPEAWTWALAACRPAFPDGALEGSLAAAFEIFARQWARAFDLDPERARRDLALRVRWDQAFRELKAAGAACFGNRWPHVARDLRIDVDTV